MATIWIYSIGTVSQSDDGSSIIFPLTLLADGVPYDNFSYSVDSSLIPTGSQDEISAVLSPLIQTAVNNVSPTYEAVRTATTLLTTIQTSASALVPNPVVPQSL